MSQGKEQHVAAKNENSEGSMKGRGTDRPTVERTRRAGFGSQGWPPCEPGRPEEGGVGRAVSLMLPVVLAPLGARPAGLRGL